MLTDATVEHVQSLLAQGLSDREVARQTGVSRGCVAYIRRGERLPNRDRRLIVDETALVFDKRRYGRCPCCGARVLLPCLACILKHLMPQPTQNDRVY